MFPSHVSTAELCDFGVNDDLSILFAQKRQKIEVNVFFEPVEKGLWRFGLELGPPRGPQVPLKGQQALTSCYAVISQLKRIGLSTDE